MDDVKDFVDISIRNLFWYLVRTSVHDSVRNSVHDSVSNLVCDLVWIPVHIRVYTPINDAIEEYYGG